MAKALVVSDSLSVAQLRDLVHRESDGRVRARLLAVAHLLSGHSPAQSEDLFGLKATQLRFWIRRYNAEGVAGLADRPRSGARPRLSPAQCEALLAQLHQGPPAETGLAAWRGEDVRRLLHTAFGIAYSLSGVYALLHRLKQSNLVPRPQHPQADPAAQARFKKSAARPLGHPASRASGSASAVVVSG